MSPEFLQRANVPLRHIVGKRDNSINLKEGKPLVRYTHEQSLLFSESETAKMTLRENRLAIGSRPFWGVTFRPTCLRIRCLVVPGI